MIVAQAPEDVVTRSQFWTREPWPWAGQANRAEDLMAAYRTPRRSTCRALVQWHRGICKTISKPLHLCVLREGAPLGEWNIIETLHEGHVLYIDTVGSSSHTWERLTHDQWAVTWAFLCNKSDVTKRHLSTCDAPRSLSSSSRTCYCHPRWG